MDPRGQQLVAQLMLTAGFWLLQPWMLTTNRLLAFRAMESLSEGQGLLRWNLPDQVREKPNCHQAGQAGEESFKLGNVREREVATHREVRK